jgi:hypothetical protein
MRVFNFKPTEKVVFDKAKVRTRRFQGLFVTEIPVIKRLLKQMQFGSFYKVLFINFYKEEVIKLQQMF